MLLIFSTQTPRPLLSVTELSVTFRSTAFCSPAVISRNSSVFTFFLALNVMNMLLPVVTILSGLVKLLTGIVFNSLPHTTWETIKATTST